jgi:hypothetical protein
MYIINDAVMGCIFLCIRKSFFGDKMGVDKVV